MRTLCYVVLSFFLLVQPDISVAQQPWLAKVYVKAPEKKLLLVHEMFFNRASNMWVFYTDSVKAGIVHQTQDNVIIQTPAGYVHCDADTILFQRDADSTHGIFVSTSEDAVNFTLAERKRK